MNDKEFGGLIVRLINKEDLSREETKKAFSVILRDETTEMQQGAFLAALCAKGETEEEVAGAWEAIYGLDTAKVNVSVEAPLVENSGTGMDSFKTFNISTAASVVAAAGGVIMARHGARALTSVCGTVDMAEALGVDVDCPIEVVAKSIVKAGLGLFNGMSPTVHPHALSRILSKIHFGSTLNIAASLANPAMPKVGVRGVFSKEMLIPVSKVMHAIGYERALVIYGEINGSNLGIDEASVCGTTHIVELNPDGTTHYYSIKPEQLGLSPHNPEDLKPNPKIDQEARKFVKLMKGEGDGARNDITAFNAALILYVAGKADSIEKGVDMAFQIISSGKAYQELERWVEEQNRYPDKGLEKVRSLS